MPYKYAGNEQFSKLLHKVGLENNMRDVAAYLDMPYPTLAEKLNPDNKKHFGCRHLPDFLEATGDRRPLDFLAQILGFVLIKINGGQQIERDWLRHISRISKEAGEAVTALADAMADGHMDKGERKRCLKETYEAIEALASLWWALKQVEDSFE